MAASGRFAVIGLGHFGRAIARALAQKGAEVFGIDTDQDIVNQMSDHLAYTVSMDGADKKALQSHDITEFDAVIVTIGQDFEQLLMCVVTLMELGVKRIIARSQGKNSRLILEKMGVKEILSPEDEVGEIVAERLTNPGLISYLQLPDEYRVAEILTPPNLVGQTIESIKLRERYNLSLITIKQWDPGYIAGSDVLGHHIKGVPSYSTILEERDYVIVFGKDKDIQRFIEINQ